MQISIRPTVPGEADVLAALQQAAFQPLYERYHDAGNPALRGPEDILRRLNCHNRYFTILADGELVGGIFYRLHGLRMPDVELAPGDYYLARVYVRPDLQGRGVAREAIRLCEREFPDARAYFVDFPADLGKNRRCYEAAGFHDSGEVFRAEGAPTLALYEKAAETPVLPKNVRHPVIFEVEDSDLPACLDVIHKSFATVAAEFGLTRENCPKHTSFLPLAFLTTQKSWGWRMFGLFAGDTVIGYYSLSETHPQPEGRAGGAGNGTARRPFPTNEPEDAWELHNLCILPAYRHSGFGARLLDHAKAVVRENGGNVLKLGIIEESAVLKNWYISQGFVHTGTRKFDHLPFTSGYLEWRG